jgi:carboxylesterase
MSHGQRTARTMILVHGFTNCPRQFQALGQSFFERGYNVLLPRLPYHGYADRLTSDFAKLTAEELAAFTDELINIGAGLGDHLTIGGISGGGVASAWAYQFRPEVDQALIIAPSFGVTYVPQAINSGITQLARTLVPNVFIWWDSKLKINTKPDYAYPRFSSRALAEIMRLGYAVRYAAAGSKPAGGRAIVVTVGGDPGVDNAVARQLGEQWQKHNSQVIYYEFPVELKLIHDLIDPNQPWQQVDVVYPKLIELAEAV